MGKKGTKRKREKEKKEKERKIRGKIFREEKLEILDGLIVRREGLFGMRNTEERAIRWVLNNSGETLPSSP